MDEIYSWLLAILVIFAYFVPKILSFLFTVGTLVFAVWAIVDMPKFMGMKGKINRGFKVSNRPLSKELKHYLENLSGDVVDYRDTPFGNNLSAFIRKQDGEVLIRVRQWYGFRWRRSWPFIGYVNLLSSTPVLEIRSSLPFHLFLASLAMTIVLLPVVIGLYVFRYGMEIQIIEKFLQSKVELSS